LESQTFTLLKPVVNISAANLFSVIMHYQFENSLGPYDIDP